jgi:hypothetical protein
MATPQPLTKEAVRELVARHGYKLRRRGADYRVIDSDGECMGGTLEGIAEWLDMIETAKANGERIQIYSACGTPQYSFDPAQVADGSIESVSELLLSGLGEQTARLARRGLHR